MKKNSTNLLVLLAVIFFVALGCKLLKGNKENVKVDLDNRTKTNQSSSPSTKMPPSKAIAWELGNKTSLAAILYNVTGNQSSDSLSKAKILAEAVGATVPPFPTKTGDKIKDTAAILGYLLNDVFKNVGAKVKDKYGETEAALFEMSLKTNTLLLIYGPGDSTGTTMVQVIKSRAKTGDLPENLWMPLVNKIEGGASFDEVKEAVLKLQTDVSDYLNK